MMDMCKDLWQEERSPRKTDEFTSSRTQVSTQTAPIVNFYLDFPMDLESLD